MTNELQAITETSCLVNVMHEILVDLWNQKMPTIAVCPTQYLEGRVVGFDAALPDFDKLLVLQFKAYKRYRKKVLDYFAVSNKQHNILLQYPPKCAFYVFADYKTHSDMIKDKHLEYSARQYYKILNNTWFVDAHSIPSNTRRIPRDELQSGQTPSLRWTDLSNRMANCLAGFRIAKVQDHYILLSPQERTVEVLKLSKGTFSFLYTKITGENH